MWGFQHPQGGIKHSNQVGGESALKRSIKQNVQQCGKVGIWPKMGLVWCENGTPTVISHPKNGSQDRYRSNQQT